MDHIVASLACPRPEVMLQNTHVYLASATHIWGFLFESYMVQVSILPSNNIIVVWYVMQEVFYKWEMD